MNFKVVFKIVGRVLTMEGIVMLIPMLVALHYGEDVMPFIISSTVGSCSSQRSMLSTPDAVKRMQNLHLFVHLLVRFT